jgi:hypothetical protein
LLHSQKSLIERWLKQIYSNLNKHDDIFQSAPMAACGVGRRRRGARDRESFHHDDIVSNGSSSILILAWSIFFH